MSHKVKTVHLIFKTHLDIGFTDYAYNVIATYFDVYIPKAIETARILREEGRVERFVWTTGSWLIYEYLEQAAPAARRRLETAIAAGDIAWHGLPFTTHTELLDVSLFCYGLSLSQKLDERFGKHTIAAKMTDVPGHTRGIIPLLAEAGIRFLHIGVNPASTPPDVPPVFVWQDPNGQRVTVMYHKGSYGDAMRVAGLADAITFAHTGDNLGPQSPEQVIHVFQKAQKQFPQARIIASTLNKFAESLTKLEQQLPVITQEIGDTWIHGVGTDPWKVSRFRELSRLRREWLNSGKLSVTDKRFDVFCRALLLIPEHTWGMDEKTYLADYSHYTAEQFQAARPSETFKQFALSWKEQRAYLDTAVDALGDSRLAEEAETRLNALQPVYPEKEGWASSSNLSDLWDTAFFEVGFDTENGAISHLIEKTHGRQWASSNNPMGLFRYQTFSQEDYDRFWEQYIVHKSETAKWALYDFTKPGMAAARPASRFWPLRLSALYWRQVDGNTDFLLELSPMKEAVAAYGCPEQVTVEIHFSAKQPIFHYNVQWFNKPASRLPEAIWFSFCPQTLSGHRWKLDKLEQSVSPLEIVRNGNRKLHAVGSGVQYQDEHARLSINSLDTPLVAPGKPSLLDFNNRQPLTSNGMHFNLYNNVWGTNFPMWYEDDARFRFVVNQHDHDYPK